MKQHHPELKTDTTDLEKTIHYKDDELANVNDKALDTMLNVLEKIEVALISRNEEIKAYIQKIICQFDEFLTEEKKQKFEKAMEKFDIALVCAFMNLYILSGITYPHIKSRYPDEKITKVTIYDENHAVVKHKDRIFIMLERAIAQLKNFMEIKNERRN
jgi:hypothetical protein